MIQSKTAHTVSMAKVIECTNNSTGTLCEVQPSNLKCILNTVLIRTTFLYLPKKDLADHGEPLAKCRLAHS